MKSVDEGVVTHNGEWKKLDICYIESYDKSYNSVANNGTFCADKY